MNREQTITGRTTKLRMRVTGKHPGGMQRRFSRRVQKLQRAQQRRHQLNPEMYTRVPGFHGRPARKPKAKK